MTDNLSSVSACLMLSTTFFSLMNGLVLSLFQTSVISSFKDSEPQFIYKQGRDLICSFEQSIRHVSFPIFIRFSVSVRLCRVLLQACVFRILLLTDCACLKDRKLFSLPFIQRTIGSLFPTRASFIRQLCSSLSYSFAFLLVQLGITFNGVAVVAYAC